MALSMMSKGEWNKVIDLLITIKKYSYCRLVDVADFALQEQPADINLMVAISRAWYNGSYTMATKKIKSLELHYITSQFLKKSVRLCRKTGGEAHVQRESTLTFRPLVIFGASGSYAATACL